MSNDPHIRPFRHFWVAYPVHLGTENLMSSQIWAKRPNSNILWNCNKDVKVSVTISQRKGQFTADFVHPHRLISEADHNPVPQKDGGGVNVQKGVAIKILEFFDYH